MSERREYFPEKLYVGEDEDFGSGYIAEERLGDIPWEDGELVAEYRLCVVRKAKVEVTLD